MEIKIEESDPLSNVIQFKREQRKPQLQIREPASDACRHINVYVEKETRLVTCQKCDTQLDAFAVLLEMAKKERRWLWDLETWEAMRDSRLSDRYDLEWQKRSGDIVDPPSDLELREIWELFHGYLGDKFCGMYRRKARKRTGPMWYARTTQGGRLSLDYVRSALIPKAVAVMPAQPSGNEAS
jgi:hypothetical protein